MIKVGKKGFTVIELLIVIALVAVAAGLLFSFLGQGLSLYTLSSEASDEQQSLRQVLSDITNRVRLADKQSISCSGNVLTIGDTVYALSGDQVLRGDAAIANRIASFEASIDAGLLQITIVSQKGSEIATSLSLAG